MKLDQQDLRFAIIRLPISVRKIMESQEWRGNVFVGGGYIRSIVAGEPINDVDLFVKSEKDAELLAYKLCKEKSDVFKTDNAYTIRGKMCIQIIHRWVFEKPEDVSNSFDFTVCCAVIFCTDNKNVDAGWGSFADDRFYVDLASKRLVYRKPIRNEDAGGSLLRVLKYYQRGYRIPLDSLGAVIARLNTGVDINKLDGTEVNYASIVTGLLRAVDPQIDPFHEAHLPSQIKLETL